MADDKVIVINNYGLEQRTSSTGRQRYTIKVTAEPIAVNLDTKSLGATVANAIADLIRRRIQAIGQVASPATLLRRKYAKTAFAAGKPWAAREYSGGKIGSMPPAQTDRLFNDSGRLAKSITANASSDNAWRVNVAANRLSGDTNRVTAIFNRLVAFVPELANPALLMDDENIKRAMWNSIADMIRVAKATNTELKLSVAQSLFSIAKQVGGILRGA